MASDAIYDLFVDGRDVEYMIDKVDIRVAYLFNVR